jgi:hypothetical protein
MRGTRASVQRWRSSLLDALEGSLRIFEKHRALILAQLQITQGAVVADGVREKESNRQQVGNVQQ